MVRLRILKKIPMMVIEVPALCTALTEEMKKMVVDTNWRIRKELAIVMPAVMTHMGQDYYADNFMAPFLTLLRDGVGEVRLASAESLPKLTTSANAQWVHEKLFPAVRDLSADEYLLRMSMISALQGRGRTLTHPRNGTSFTVLVQSIHFHTLSLHLLSPLLKLPLTLPSLLPPPHPCSTILPPCASSILLPLFQV